MKYLLKEKRGTQWIKTSFTFKELLKYIILAYPNMEWPKEEYEFIATIKEFDPEGIQVEFL